MDALRRAETQERDPEEPADSEVEQAVAETDALELEPLQPAPAPEAISEPPQNKADSGESPAAQPQPAAPSPQPEPEPQAEPAAKRFFATPAASPLKKQLAYFVTAGVTILLVVGGYYLWRSNQVIDPTSAYSETLIDAPVLPDISETVAPLMAAHDNSAVQAEEGPVAVQPGVIETTRATPATNETPVVTGSGSPSHIEIRKNQKIRSVHPLLQKAYGAYQQQDYAEAEQLYRQAAKRYPGNRDALLGLAGVAMHQGNLRVARYYYETVLESFPGDKVARVALQSLSGTDDTLQESSQIKHWLRTDGGNAQLHFALGNRYAQLGQWQEAQSAYFDAFRINPGQPDYAFNLAVSLDQLGLYQQALEYYRKARELQKHSAGLFSPSQLDSRIRRLEAVAPEVTP